MSCWICFSAQAADKEVWQQVYGLLLDNYIDEVDLFKLFSPAVKALSLIDKNIRVAPGDKTVTIYYKGKMQKVFSLPQEERNAKKWAEVTNSVLEEVKKISPEMERKDFELTEMMLYHGMQEFDKNSRYFPVLDVGQKTEKIQGYNTSLLEGDILYIRLGTINDYTAEKFKETLSENKSVKGIVIDLRGNKGGYLRQALEISDAFIENGEIIYTLGKKTGKRKSYYAEHGEFFKNVPMVVLIDGKTASSAEVIAMALRENHRAQLIGGQSYGKNTVQNIYPLENGAHLALTTERFYSPKNIPIEEVGLHPNVCSEVFDTSSDIDELLSHPYNFACQKLSRQSSFDLDVALRVLQKQQQQNSSNMQALQN